jgi:3-deoxy-D-manno-octulosonic-acid transferase
LATKYKLNCQILNDGDLVNPDKEILIINSFGALYKYYNYCKNVFVGKSLIKKLKKDGGQNPIEAAKFGCKVYSGPYVYNFQEVYEFLKVNNMSEQVNDEYDLSKKIIEDLKKPKNINEQNINLLNSYGEQILKQTITELNKLVIIKNENA